MGGLRGRKVKIAYLRWWLNKRNKKAERRVLVIYFEIVCGPGFVWLRMSLSGRPIVTLKRDVGCEKRDVAKGH